MQKLCKKLVSCSILYEVTCAFGKMQKLGSLNFTKLDYAKKTVFESFPIKVNEQEEKYDQEKEEEEREE